MLTSKHSQTVSAHLHATDSIGEFRKAHSVLKLQCAGCTNTNIISHCPWLYLFKTPELNVENNFLVTFKQYVVSGRVFFPGEFLPKCLYTFVTSNTETCPTLFISQNFSPVT